MGTENGGREGIHANRYREGEDIAISTPNDTSHTMFTKIVNNVGCLFSFPFLGFSLVLGPFPLLPITPSYTDYEWWWIIPMPPQFYYYFIFFFDYHSKWNQFIVSIFSYDPSHPIFTNKSLIKLFKLIKSFKKFFFFLYNEFVVHILPWLLCT